MDLYLVSDYIKLYRLNGEGLAVYEAGHYRKSEDREAIDASKHRVDCFVIEEEAMFFIAEFAIKAQTEDEGEERGTIYVA